MAPPACRPARSDLDVATLADPFAHLHRDADFEASTDGSTPGEAYGEIYEVAEHGMGWSVFGEASRLMQGSSLVFQSYSFLTPGVNCQESPWAGPARYLGL